MEVRVQEMVSGGRRKRRENKLVQNGKKSENIVTKSRVGLLAAQKPIRRPGQWKGRLLYF